MANLAVINTSLRGRARRVTPAGLGRFLGRRIGIGLVLMVGITLVAFVLTHLVPGNPAAANLGQRALGDPAIVKAFNHEYGLDKPVVDQYVIYLGKLLHGNLGISEQSHRAVVTDLAEYVPATIELALFAIVISLVLGVGLGILAAVRRGKLVDGVIRVISLLGVSMPTFWVALLAFYLFFFRLGWFPSGGRLGPAVTPPGNITGLYTVDALLHGDWSLFASALDHLVLPGLVLGIYTVGTMVRFTRASVLEVINNDYVRAARVKGLSEWTVIRRHVVRPALLGIATVSGVAFGSLLSGTVLVENIFGWPGIGQYAYNSAINLDLPAIMGVSMVVAFIYIVVNLLVDILYSILDPRIELR
ncbi:MAG: binding-protein-dependent transport system inner rane component [Acidimicrobiaceae bacterium]|nr:binding-protein-dependent transport system inner rane component [Acidimicrobiaceae bacterium]